MNPSPEQKDGNLVWLALAVLMVGAHAWAASNPEGACWGIHFLGYLPTSIRWGFLILALVWIGIFLGTKWFSTWIARFEDLAQSPKAWIFFSLATGVLASVCFYSFPIATDVYGDSWNMEKWHGDNREFQWKWVTGAFHPNIMVHKESLTIGFHRILSFWTGADIRTVYAVVANVAGGGVLFLWTLFLRNQEFAGLRLPLWLAGVFLGATGVFFGQAENYPLPMLLMTLFFMLALRVAKGGGPVWLLWVLFLVLVRSHATFMVWIPGLVYLSWFRLRGHRPAAYWVPWVLIALGGAILYFVILKSHYWPDDLIKGRRDLFLPFATGPNLGFNYTLFNSAHLIDLVNSVAQLAAAPVLMVFGAMLVSRRTLRLRAWPGFLAQGTSLTLAFFFFLNPALSMPRDWDLFCLLGLALLFFCAGYLSGRKWSAKTVRGLTLMALIAGTLAIPMHVTHASRAAVSERIEDIGEYAYGNYHIGAGFIVNAAQKMAPEASEAVSRRSRSLERLKPVGKIDEERAFLLYTGSAYATLAKQDSLALAWAEECASYSAKPFHGHYLVEQYLKVGNYGEAASKLQILLLRDPNDMKTLTLGASLSVLVEDRDSCRTLIARALQIDSEDPEVQRVLKAALTFGLIDAEEFGSFVR